MTSFSNTKGGFFRRQIRVIGVGLFCLSSIGVYAYLTHQLPLKVVRADVVPSSHVSATSTAHTFATSTHETNAFVIRAVDGDTLLATLDGMHGEQRIRLLGVNTPETVDPRKPVECFGKEASAYMHHLVDGTRVYLASDPQADERDKYGRLLRSVYLADGTDVNAELVREGYAYAYLSFPLNPFRRRELNNLEQDAKLSKQGLWNPETCNGKP